VNVLAVGKLLLHCRLLGGARRFGAHWGGEGLVSWSNKNDDGVMNRD